jgi:hypothetical protein
MDPDKQKYYEYEPADGGHWWVKDRPSREKWFEDELVELAGLHDGRKPRLRVVWGGTVMSDIAERPQLKYMRMVRVRDGYNYIKKDGEVGVTQSINTVTDARVPWRSRLMRLLGRDDVDDGPEFTPRYKELELGRLRWIVEQYVPPETLRLQRRFEKLHDENGKKIKRDFPNEGIYDHFFLVQTADRKYRDLDREVLTAVQAMYLYNLNTSEAQKTLDDIERQKNATLLGANEARQIMRSM